MRNSKKRDTVENDRFVRVEELPESLKDVLCDSELRSNFMFYLRGKLAEENLLFYESVERFQVLPTQELRNKMGNDILRQFIQEDSLYWLNVSGVSRDALLIVKDFQQDTFQDLKVEIYHLMNNNFFAGFKSSLMGTEERKESNVHQSSFADLTEVLGRLNVNEELSIEDCGCKTDTNGEICCEKRQQMIQSVINTRTKKKWRLSITEKMQHKKAQIRKNSEASSSRGGKGTRTNRAQRAFKRVFQKKKGKKDRVMSFWEQYEQDV